MRTAIIRQWKQYSYRELAERLNDGVCLRWFTRFYSEPVPHFTSFQKVLKSIGAATWGKINDVLVEYAGARKLESGKALRADTTVVGTDIHHPTDARLLWDSIRVLTRLMMRGRKLLPDVELGFANRTKRSKKLCYQITMAKGPKAPKKRRKLYRQLLKVANEVFDKASWCLEQLQYWDGFDLQRFRAGIEGILSALMRGYGLKRCIWKGWQSFQSYVGLSVVTFNLQKIAALSLKH